MPTTDTTAKPPSQTEPISAGVACDEALEAEYRQRFVRPSTKRRPEDHDMWIENDLPEPLIQYSQCGCARYNTAETGGDELWAVMGSAIEEHPKRTLETLLKEIEWQLKFMATTPMLLCAFENLQRQVTQARDECSQISIDSCNIRFVHEAGE